MTSRRWIASCALAAAMACAATHAAPAEEPSGIVRVSLAEALQRARASSARLSQLRFLRDGAEAGLKGAQAERLPQVDLTASATRYSDVPELTLTLPPPAGSRTLFPNLPDGYASRLGVGVPLYTGGRLSASIRAADQEREAARRDVDAASEDLVLETTAAYWGLVTAHESERVLQEALAAYDAHLADAANREKLGMAARNELLAVQVERDQAELARLEAQRAAEAAGANLVRLFGLPGGSRVEPSETLERLEPPQEDPAALLEAALSSRSDRAALAARAEAADARTRAARADRMPQVRFSAGYDYANPNRRILPLEDRWQDTWDASLSLSFRIFDSGRTAAAVAQRTAQSDAARQQREDLDRRIQLEVTQRLLELQTAGAAVAVAEKSIESARENRRVAAERYRAGLIPSSELLDAEVALLKAGLERTEALARQRLALAGLDRAVGR